MKNLQITLNQTNLTKKEGFKTAYLVEKNETKIVTPEQHELATNSDTQKWFRRLGGSETATKRYTCAGYKVTKLVSTSPDKSCKNVREYKFQMIKDEN